jgi:Sulfotransferase domain
MARNHRFTQQVWQAPAVRTVRHFLSARRAYRYLTAAHRRLPDFIIAGAAKAGTTSLWWYLVEHPQVDRPLTKEVGFFDVNFHHGLHWYRMHFSLDESTSLHANQQTGRQTGESTPYYIFHPLAPERIAATLPNVKIIMLLRDPVDRAFSHYQLKIKRRHETLSFDEAIEAEAERLAGEHAKILSDPRYYSAAHDRYSYLARGLYLEQIVRWERHFPPGRLLVLESGEFFRHTAKVYQRVLDFLGLPRWQPPRFGNRYPGEYSERMKPAARRRLTEYFAPHNEQLYAHLGTRFNWQEPTAARCVA